MKTTLLILIYFISGLLTAQQDEFTLSGFVHDESSGEILINANIYVSELNSGASTNEYGFYSLTAPKGKYSVRISYVGYKTKTLVIEFNESTQQNIYLTPSSLELGEVVVQSEKSDKNIKSNILGISDITPKDIQSVPVILGEQDILKTIQLMPGVSTAGEGNSGFYVRGGKVDQNLILLDEATVYNPSHLLGFFSVFNSDAIKNARLIKGNLPPEYGGRISSVLDISMKEGNNKKYNVSGGIGLIASRLTLEGPIVNDNGSFLIAARRTYADLFLNFSSDNDIKNSSLYFYDLNLKANYRIGNSDRIFLSGYLGRDVFGFSDRFGFDWGNITSTLRWNHLFSEKLFANISLIYSTYDYTVSIQNNDGLTDVSSKISDINFKTDFEYYLNPGNTIKFGLTGFYHDFNPGEITTEGETNLNSKKINNIYAIEPAVYISHESSFTQRLSLNYGFRYSNFTLLGPGDIYTFDEYENVIGTKSYKSNEIIKTYGGLEPRVSFNFLVDETSSLKFSFTRNMQYLHLLSTSTTTTPLDIWQPSTSIIKPEIADQTAFGFFKNFLDNTYETSVELYYKDMKNQVDYKNGADILLNEYVESQLVFGKGWAYGMELSVKKNSGRFTGWLSYTLSATKRQFKEINNGSVYPARQDRTHDFSFTGMYKLNDDWTLSANWIYYTGDAVTYPSGKYTIDGNTINLYTDRNASRMPDYHRLDLGATWMLKKSGDTEMSLTFSLYNVYARKNAYTISFRENADNPLNTEAVKLSLFSIVPSATFNFKF